MSAQEYQSVEMPSINVMAIVVDGNKLSNVRISNDYKNKNRIAFLKNGYICIESEETFYDAVVELYSDSGKLIRKWEYLSGKKLSVSTSGIPTGQYLIKINGITLNGKFFIIRGE
jgi:hypothetical protein